MKHPTSYEDTNTLLDCRLLLFHPSFATLGCRLLLSYPCLATLDCRLLLSYPCLATLDCRLLLFHPSLATLGCRLLLFHPSLATLGCRLLLFHPSLATLDERVNGQGKKTRSHPQNGRHISAQNHLEPHCPRQLKRNRHLHYGSTQNRMPYRRYRSPPPFSDPSS